VNSLSSAHDCKTLRCISKMEVRASWRVSRNVDTLALSSRLPKNFPKENLPLHIGLQ
jgi:hypothetical protein